MTTTPNAFYEELSKKYNLTIEEVRQVLYFFWRRAVAKNVDECTSHELYIPRLGSFKLRDYKTQDIITKLKVGFESGFYVGTPREEPNRILLNNLIKATETLEKIKEDKAIFNELKHSRDIQKQRQDLGGPTEQSI